MFRVTGVKISPVHNCLSGSRGAECPLDFAQGRGLHWLLCGLQSLIISCATHRRSVIQTEVLQVNDLRADWKAAQVKSRPSIQRQRVRCSQQWISLVIFEAVGKHSWRFFQYSSLLRGVLGHYPQHMCMLWTCKVLVTHTKPKNSLLFSTNAFDFSCLPKQNMGDREADNQERPVGWRYECRPVRTLPKQVPTHECGSWG